MFSMSTSRPNWPKLPVIYHYCMINCLLLDDLTNSQSDVAYVNRPAFVALSTFCNSQN